MWDAAVIGAGPAGCMVAGELAGRGWDVCLIEKEKFPRPKSCGGGLPSHTVSLLAEKNIDYSPSIQATFDRARLFCDFEKAVDVELDYASLQLVDREQFDELLADWAVQRGVCLKENTFVNTVKLEDEFVVIETGDDTYEKASFLAGTDGALGVVNRSLNMGPEKFYGFARDCRIEVNDLLQEQFSDKLIFNLLPEISGYGWVFPKGNYLNVGITGYKKNISYPLFLKEFIRKTFHGCPQPSVIRTSGHVLPFFRKKTRFTRGRAALAGDSAGFVDALTGEGIYYALKSGLLLADEIDSALVRQTASLKNYSDVLDHELLVELDVSSRLARLLYAMPEFFYWLGIEKGMVINTLKKIISARSGYRDIDDIFLHGIIKKVKGC